MENAHTVENKSQRRAFPCLKDRVKGTEEGVIKFTHEKKNARDFILSFLSAVPSQLKDA